MISEKKKAASKKRRENLRSVSKKIAKMDSKDQAVLASPMANVVRINGEPLSLRNQCLLSVQSKEPCTMVGGYDQWIKAGRIVNKGEKGMGIRVPCQPREDAEEDDEEQEDGSKKRMYFTFGFVFDIRQTRKQTAEDIERIRKRDQRRKNRGSKSKGSTRSKRPAASTKPKPRPKYQATEDVDLEFANRFSNL